MKFEIIIDKLIKEKVIKIFTNEIDDEVKRIEMTVKENLNNKIVGKEGDDLLIIDFSEIYRIYSTNKKVYIRTENKEYISRLTLKEILDRIPQKTFIKISRSEIINIDYVKRLDLSFKGTISIEMKNGDITYLSRRRIPDFKKTLGI